MPEASDTKDLLKEVETAASGKITSSSTLDELKTAAELYAAIANSKKTNSEARHYGRYLLTCSPETPPVLS